MVAGNPRSANGSLRRKHRARLKAIGGECGICRGRLGPIHYDEPSDSNHPLSFVIDEIKPVSRWREFCSTRLEKRFAPEMTDAGRISHRMF